MDAAILFKLLYEEEDERAHNSGGLKVADKEESPALNYSFIQTVETNKKKTMSRSPPLLLKVLMDPGRAKLGKLN
jgi:hypothetical protein